MKPTGKLKFAYESIKNLEIKMEGLETQNIELMARCEELATALIGVMIIIENNCKAQKLKTGFINAIEVLNQTPQQSLNEIKAQAIDEFKSYVKSGLKVLSEPSWEGKRPIIIDENTYFEITLSEFDDYANQLRGV